MADFAKYYYYQNQALKITPQTNKVAVYCKTEAAGKRLYTALAQQPQFFKWQYADSERIAVLDTSYEEARNWVYKFISPDTSFIYPVYTYANKRLNGYPPLLFNGTFIVRFRDGLSPNQVAEICKQQKCVPLKQLSGPNAPYLVQYQGDEPAFLQTVNFFYEKFGKDTVLYAHPEFINAVRMEDAPPAAPIAQQDEFQQIALPNAWQRLTDKNKKMGNVRVAVLDEGIHNKHTDIALKLSNRFDQIGGACPYNPRNVHGTAVAGIIGALNNSKMLLGVAFDAELADIRISYLDNNQNRQSSTTKVVDGLQAAISWNARVINISWSHPPVDSIREKIRLALDNRAVVCCAAGNYLNGESQSVRFPASLSTEMPVLAVAACDAGNALVNWSTVTGFGTCRGPELTIAAPGLNISTLSVTNTNQWITISDFRGTSAATAFVSSAAALLLGALPTLTPTEVRDFLKNNSITANNVLQISAAMNQVPI